MLAIAHRFAISLMLSGATAAAAQGSSVAEKELEKLLGAQRLPVLKGSSITFVQPDAVDADAFRTSLERVRAEFGREFTDDRYAGARAYLDASFPAVRGEYVITKDKSGKKLVREVIRDDDARQIRFALSALLERLRSRAKLVVTLEFRSDPKSANVSLRAKTGSTSTMTTSTNSKIENVYRGLYTYSIKKEGFLETTGELNLIDSDASVVVCELVSAPATLAKECARERAE